MKKIKKIVYVVYSFWVDEKTKKWKEDHSCRWVMGIYNTLESAETFITAQLKNPVDIKICSGDKNRIGLNVSYYYLRKTKHTERHLFDVDYKGKKIYLDHPLYICDSHPTYMIEVQEVLD